MILSNFADLPRTAQAILKRIFFLDPTALSVKMPGYVWNSFEWLFEHSGYDVDLWHQSQSLLT